MYAHIRYYTYIYIHIRIYVHIRTHTPANHCREVFSRGFSRRPRASGWTPTGQTCCERPWGWTIVRGSYIGDLRAEREGRFSGPGRVLRGGMRQIRSAHSLQMAEKSGCSLADALGCPECGPPIASHGECFSRTWHRFQCLWVSFQEIHAYTYIRTYTYIYIHIPSYTYIYVHIRIH